VAADPEAAATARAAVYDRWAIGLTRERKWEQALDVYADALPRLADKSRAHNNVRYVLQEWLKDAASADPQAASAILRRTLPRFGGVPGLDEVGQNHVALRVQALTRDGQYEPALAVVDTFAPLLKDAAAAARIAAPVYDRWSQQLAAKRDWQAAADVYEHALRRFPRDPHFENNAAVTWNQWARTFIDRKDWPAAIEVYDRALIRLPGNTLLDRNRRYCEERQRQRG
jgi:tetratricopeptide (TPR) repeat protein